MALISPQKGVCLHFIRSLSYWSDGVMEKANDKSSGILSDISLKRLSSNLISILQHSLANF